MEWLLLADHWLLNGIVAKPDPFGVSLYVWYRGPGASRNPQAYSVTAY
jgi:hypothetical protein